MLTLHKQQHQLWHAKSLQCNQRANTGRDMHNRYSLLLQLAIAPMKSGPVDADLSANLEADWARGWEVNATIDAAVGNFNGGIAEAGIAARHKNLIGIL